MCVSPIEALKSVVRWQTKNSTKHARENKSHLLEYSAKAVARPNICAAACGIMGYGYRPKATGSPTVEASST